MKRLVGAIAALSLTALALPAFAQSSASNTANATALIIRPIAVSSGGTLAFGTLVRGAGTATVSTAGVRTVTGGVVALASTSPSAASFTVSGEGGQLVTVTLGALTLANTTSGSPSDNLTVALTGTNTGSQTLSGALNTAGSLTVDVGGAVTLTASTTPGAYSGSFTVTAAYQ
jgi:hypothetical protein